MDEEPDGGTDAGADAGADPDANADAGADADAGTDGPADPADEPGTVYLVGSGPGDPDLLTVRARRLLESVDVVLHDRLPGPEILESIPPERREDVGKLPGGDRTPQSEINERLVELAREGQDVVRLKGGDPFVFGRGGEELEHLSEHDVPVEVVPGVSSALAAPGVAGIPATHRDHASSVTFVTGHEDPAKEESAVDWAALAETGGTLVVLMGVRRLPDYCDALVDAGMDPETPIALVERATWPAQQVATGTLETAVDVRDRADVTPPAVTVIGEVAGTRERVLDVLETSYGGDRTAGSPEPDDGSEGGGSEGAGTDVETDAAAQEDRSMGGSCETGGKDD